MVRLKGKVRLITLQTWLWFFFSAEAHAGYSLDVELLRSTLAAGTPPGVDSPLIAGQGSVRVGAVYQYERDPVILYKFNEEVGALLVNRRVLQVGASWDASDRLSLRASLPMAVDGGAEVSEEDALTMGHEGAGLGDLSVGGRVKLAEAGPLTLGLHADAYAPTGKREAYLGEGTLRVKAGISGMVEVGPALLVADGAYAGRRTDDTGLDYKIEPTFDLNLGAVVGLWPDRLNLTAALLTRGGASSLSTRGGRSGEGLIGAQIFPGDGTSQWDLGVGKGIADGVGSTAFRYYVAYTWVRPPDAPPPPPPESQIKVTEQPPEEIVPEQIEVEELPPPEWKPDELARIQQDQIVIRDPINFEFGTDTILPESMATLEAVAKILHDHAEIGHIVIEGHASEEGSFAYNYDLSNLRARAIWKGLILAGVHPSRMSYRGMSEVVPKTAGTDEASLATNRRVEFHIVERFTPEEGYPVYPAEVLAPWSGETVKITQPKQPEVIVAPPPKTTEEMLEELLNPNNFRDDDEEEDEEAPKPEESP